MSITSDLIRGHTETIILAQLYNHDSYGYEINKEIQQRTKGKYELKKPHCIQPSDVWKRQV